MSADETAARLAMDARADIRLLFDENGKFLDPHDWPDEIANSIRSIEPTSNGLKVRLNDSLQARRLILELAVKFRGPADGVRDLAEILAEKWKE